MGKLIDEHDESKRANINKEDFAYKLAKYFKENPLSIAALFLIGAGAICARTYLLHTAGKFLAKFFSLIILNLSL